MRKITLLAASLLMTCASFAQVSLEKVWEFSEKAGNKPTWMSTDNQRAMDIYNDNLYITDIKSGVNHAILVLDTKDGSLAKSLDSGKAGWGGMGGVAISDKGTLLVSRGLSPTFFVNKVDIENGGIVGKPDGEGFIPAADQEVGRVDNFNVWGDIEGEGGYVSFAGCGLVDGKHLMKIIPVIDGKPQTANAKIVQVPNSSKAITSCATLPHDGTHVWVAGSNLTPQLINIEDGTAETFGAVKPVGDANGMAEFEFKGKKYFVSSESKLGAFGIYDITNGLANALKVGQTTSDMGTKGSTFSCPIAVKVASDHVMIYVLATSNGIAAYKFVDNTPAPEPTTCTSVTPAGGEVSVAPTEVKFVFSADVTIESAELSVPRQLPVKLENYTKTGKEIAVTIPATVTEGLEFFAIVLKAKDAVGNYITYGIADGYVRVEYSIVSSEPRNTFMLESVEPANEAQVNSLKSITLRSVMPGEMGHPLGVGDLDASAVVNLFNAEKQIVTTATLSCEYFVKPSDVIVTLSKDVVDAGTYTLIIPEGAIKDAMAGEPEETFNPELKFTYTVDGSAVSISKVESKMSGEVSVYSVQGIKVCKGDADEVLKNLAPGLYIVNGKKVAIGR